MLNIGRLLPEGLRKYLGIATPRLGKSWVRPVLFHRTFQYLVANLQTTLLFLIKPHETTLLETALLACKKESSKDFTNKHLIVLEFAPKLPFTVILLAGSQLTYPGISVSPNSPNLYIPATSRRSLRTLSSQQIRWRALHHSILLIAPY